jgi:hypothetical protein
MLDEMWDADGGWGQAGLIVGWPIDEFGVWRWADLPL